MKHLHLLALVLLTGCTTFSVTQIDESPDERKITSIIKATSWFSSTQSIEKLKALQTDKTQSFGAEQASQQGATNLVEVINATANLIGTAAAAMAK